MSTKNMFPQKSVGQYLQRPHKIVRESIVDVGVVPSTYLMHLLPLQSEPCLAGHESWSRWDGQGNRTGKKRDAWPDSSSTSSLTKNQNLPADLNGSRGEDGCVEDKKNKKREMEE